MMRNHDYLKMPEIKKPPQGWFSYLAHSEGFEPSTARFVAEYSIQLSYECVLLAWLSATQQGRVI